MKARDLAAVLVLLLVALTVGSGTPAASADTCPQTKAVFYTTDTQFLATRLGANKSDCADYYISISPTSAGEPRDGPALTTVHNQGPQFHALAELRPRQWADYAAVNGWRAAGAKLHDDMIDAGYDPVRDTWAVNEVGSPTTPGSTFATDVFNGVDDARKNFRDFVQGLHDGSGRPGYEAMMKGVVFAADAPQLASNVDDYVQKLAAWYTDAPFWEDMNNYVSVWAQETYADVRAWGVGASTLADRTAYLNDYFLHGLRVAEDGNDDTAAARAFLEQAYFPLANAAHRYAPPSPPEGPGYGSTDIPVPGMQQFISAETYAERTTLGTRIGFAVDPQNTTQRPTNKTLIDDRVAAAIHDSQTEPIGACTATNESCDVFVVTDAAFPNSWKALANTQEETGVTVQLHTGVSVTFDVVSARGSTWFTSLPTTDTPAGWNAVGPTYEIATSAATTGRVRVCLGAGTGHVFRRSGGSWTDITTSPGCGTADATDLPGKFALFVDPTPPVIVSNVTGQQRNGWYVGDVSVSWDVSDPQTPVSSKTGCEFLTVTEDTTGTTSSCTATSEGGTETAQVTVKRDSTPPDLTCTPPPSTWKATDVSIACGASDGGSGLADQADASFDLSTSVQPGTETANASTDTRSVCDTAGNCATAGPIDGIKVDEKGPSLNCDTAPTSWQATNVTIPCKASDGGSGLVNSADANFSLTTNVQVGTETANASTDTHSVCDTAGNCATAGPIDGIKIDEKGPSLDCGLAPTFLLNQAGATVTAAVADAGSGVAASSVSAAADTSAAGSHTVDLTAADNVGNSTTASCPYSVGYALSGFGRPIANTPTVNTGKAGRTYPVKWQLQDANSVYISTLTAVAQIVIQPTACDDFATDPDSTLTATATGTTSLRYDSGANQYVYNWATPSTAGCYTLFVELDSGQILPAYFQLN